MLPGIYNTVVYIYVYEPCQTLFTRKWRVCKSQMDWSISQILLFLDNLSMFYQAFGVNLSFDKCGMLVAGGACASIRY